MSADRDARPLLALTVGDPAGIGPELVAAVVADGDLARVARLLVIGPVACRPPGLSERAAGQGEHEWLACAGPRRWEMGVASAQCGGAALAALRMGHDLARAREVDALVTAPVCKQALSLAGEDVEGQTALLARWDGARECEMVAVAGVLRVMFLTRHLALREALACVTRDAVLPRLELFERTLRGLGIESPRIAVAGLNPHAGEGGMFGDEELRELEPAVAAARAAGLAVDGPVSPDSVFLEGAQGRYDGVLALYHDQGFIPLKLLSEGRGVTFLAGLSYLRVSPVHGTAFDIAGQGRADATNLREAVAQAARWAMGYRATALGAGQEG